MLNNIKIAIVHDWLVTYAGAERVLEQMIICYPDADLFSVVEHMPEDKQGFLHGKSVKTTFIQNLPMSKKKHRAYLPLMPLAIEQIDLSDYDVIISSSHAVAKGVITGPDQLHISYVHSPIRYAWDLQHQYLKETGLNKGFKGWLAKWMLHKIRIWDQRTANGVDCFVANSHFIARRIMKVYRRQSTVIYPPVDLESFALQESKDGYYLTASRLVPYKKISLIVDAFNAMPDKRLIVIGDGPDMSYIKTRAGANVEVLGYQPFDVLVEYMQNAKCFVFAALEDFGIMPVEAQACGCPVVAYGKGGVLESIINRETGLFFDRQDVSSIVDAVKVFETLKIDPALCRENAERFSTERFREEFGHFVQDKCDSFFAYKRVK